MSGADGAADGGAAAAEPEQVEAPDSGGAANAPSSAGEQEAGQQDAAQPAEDGAADNGSPEAAVAEDEGDSSKAVEGNGGDASDQGAAAGAEKPADNTEGEAADQQSDSSVDAKHITRARASDVHVSGAGQEEDLGAEEAQDVDSGAASHDADNGTGSPNGVTLRDMSPDPNRPLKNIAISIFNKTSTPLREEDTPGKSKDAMREKASELDCGLAEALYDCDPESNLELAFVEGQLLEILEVNEDGWCVARTEYGATGMVPSTYIKMRKTSSPRSSLEEEAVGECMSNGDLRRAPSDANKADAPSVPPRVKRRQSSKKLIDTSPPLDSNGATSPPPLTRNESDKPMTIRGEGPMGPYEIVQVITPEMANKLVLNRGAIFSKYSYKKASVGVHQKMERLVWLSEGGKGGKIMWQDPVLPQSQAQRNASPASPTSSTPNSIDLKDVTGMSKCAPAHYGADESLTLYVITNTRSLCLEAKDTDDRDFWFGQLCEHWSKAQAELKERKRQEKQVERDIRIPERRRQWIQEILPNFEAMRNSKQCKTLCWLGVPTNLRMDVWRLCIGNQLQITKDLYEIFRAHARQARKQMELARQRAIDSGGSIDEHEPDGSQLLGSESSLKVLDKDLPRTFSQLGFFHKGGPLEQNLRDVLEAYIFYRPDVGYVQGMSYLAAMLLLTMDTYQAFVSLTNLLHSHYFLSFFAMDMVQIRIRFAVYEYFFEKQLPDLFERFTEIGVSTDLYLLNWLMTLFAKSLPLDITTRIWDNYLLNGESFMIRASLGVLKWLSHLFVDLPFEDLMVTVTHLHQQDDIDEEELFECIASIKVSEQEFAAVLKEKKAEFAKEDGTTQKSTDFWSVGC